MPLAETERASRTGKFLSRSFVHMLVVYPLVITLCSSGSCSVANADFLGPAHRHEVVGYPDLGRLGGCRYT
jgi:hypothetical protein